MILPQAWPVIIAVAIFHLRLLVERLLRAADLPLDASPSSSRSRWASSGSTASTTGTRRYVQAGTLMTMVIPVVLFLIFQRVFIRGVVITGVEK